MSIYINWKKFIDDKLADFEPGEGGSGGVDIPKVETVDELPNEAEVGDLTVVLDIGEIYVYTSGNWKSTGIQGEVEGITEDEAKALFSKKDHTHDDLEERIGDLEQGEQGITEKEADKKYADKKHSHNDLEVRIEDLEAGGNEGVLTEEDAVGLFARKDHTHDNYADQEHTHADYETRLRDLEDRPISGGGEGDLTQEEADKRYAKKDLEGRVDILEKKEIDLTELINDEEEGKQTTYSSEKIERRIAEEKVDTSELEPKIEVFKKDEELPDPFKYEEGVKIIKGNTIYERGTRLEGAGEITPIYELVDDVKDVYDLDIIKSLNTNSTRVEGKDYHPFNMLAKKPRYAELRYAEDDPEYIIIEFENTVSISEFDFTAGGNYKLAGSFIDASIDGVDWETIHHIEKGLSTKDNFKLEKTYEAKYLRIIRNTEATMMKQNKKQLYTFIPKGPGGTVVPSWNKVLTSKSIMEVETENKIDTNQKNNLFFVKEDYTFVYVDEDGEINQVGGSGDSVEVDIKELEKHFALKQYTEEEVEILSRKIDRTEEVLEGRIENLEGKEQGLTQIEANELYAKKNHEHEEIGDLKNEVEWLKNKIEELENSFSNKVDEYEQLEKMIDNLTILIESLEDEIEKLKNSEGSDEEEDYPEPSDEEDF